MHYSLFVPDQFVAGSTPAETLDGVGLPDLILGASGRRLEAGPDGAGLLFAWEPLPRDIQPDGLEWIAAKPTRDLPSRRYWLGFGRSPSLPPELERPYAFGGTAVTLADGHPWLVPQPAALSFDVKSSDDGTWRYVLQRRFHRYGQEVVNLRRRVLDGTIFELSAGDLCRFAWSALSLNYRLPVEAIDHLRLLDSHVVKDVFFAAVGGDQ